MNKIKAIIVDDEASARNVLNQLLTKVSSDIEVTGLYVNLVEAVEAIKLNKPDVVFLDVQMPNYAGYEIVSFFEEIEFEIIFVTAYDQYAIKAFEMNAIDYIVKPINRQRLKESIDRLGNKINVQNNQEQYKILLESIQKQEFKKIIISEIGGKRIININEILAIEAEGSYCKIILAQKEAVLVSKNLKFVEALLPTNDTFFRSHKSWIVSSNYITSYSFVDGFIQVDGKIKAKLSRYRVQEFKELVARTNL